MTDQSVQKPVTPLERPLRALHFRLRAAHNVRPNRTFTLLAPIEQVLEEAFDHDVKYRKVRP